MSRAILLLTGILTANSFLLLSFRADTLFAQEEKEAELRLWHDQQGNEITARFQRYREGIVYLRGTNRQTVQVAPGQLSRNDQQYIVKLLQAGKKEKLAEEFERLCKSNAGSAVGGGRAPVKNFRGGRPANSGGVDSGEAMANPPDSGNGFGRQKAGAVNGGRRGNAQAGGTVPGSRPPMTTPAGDAPVTFGGDPNRTPSPYTRTPDSEEMELDSKPDGDVARGGGVNPFADTGFNRPDISRGVPSSSMDYDGKPGEIKSKVKNPGLDPFAELNPVEAANSQPPEVKDNPFENQAPSTGYQPPVILNKSEEPSGGQSESAGETPANTAGSGPSWILIAISVVGLMVLVMIILLIMVLARSSAPRPRQSYR
ncbi:MAG: SHD1 domain-containing protein [Planctomycetota bacterium]|nr:SHD1 domain-containing protein [Planctomycetota bacterium]